MGSLSHSGTTKGFTGHEMLDAVGIIHMNGRIYDAKLGRFLQADPLIQAPMNTQSLNRYSYTLNNPLNATDPSGYSFKKLFTAVVSIAVGVFCQACGASLWAAMATGAALGAFSAIVNGGNILKGALFGAFSAGAFHGIGSYFDTMIDSNQAGFVERMTGAGMDKVTAIQVSQGVGLTASQALRKIAAHGLVGGTMSTLRGGKFGHGFFAAGATQASAGKIGKLDSGNSGYSAQRTVAAAVVGGTVSKATGGKFGNGAVQGAFSRAFNDEAHLSVQLKAPRAANLLSGALKWALDKDVTVDGLSFTLAWSSPNLEGEGEWDLGFAVSTDLQATGLSTGKLAIAYGESYDSSASVRDLAGFDPKVSTDIAVGGFASSLSGWEYHVGPGAGASYAVEATSVFSLRHRKWFDWNSKKDE